MTPHGAKMHPSRAAEPPPGAEPAREQHEGHDAQADEVGPTSRGPGQVHAARLRCDNCRRVTVHRIVRWDPRSTGPAKRWNGLARCRECGWTHPFEVVRAPEKELDLIVSRGAVSERRRIRLPVSNKLAVGTLVPGEDPPLEVRRIAGIDGESVREARVSNVETVWVVPPLEHRLAVSVAEGGRTHSFRWVVKPDTAVVVGEPFAGEGGTVWVVAFRSRGRTWRRPGDRAPAGEVQRLYGRRTVSPPAGRSDWRRGRGTPSSLESSTSRSPRRRSSPGVKRTRT